MESDHEADPGGRSNLTQVATVSASVIEFVSEFVDRIARRHDPGQFRRPHPCLNPSSA